MSSAVIDRAASLPTVAVENLKLPSVFLARKGERAGGRRGFELLPRTRLYAIIMHSSKHSPLGNIGAEQVLKALSPCWMLQVDLALFFLHPQYPSLSKTSSCCLTNFLIATKRIIRRRRCGQEQEHERL